MLAGVVCLFGISLVANAQERPLPPREAPLRMTLPNGFKATLFAGEPDVVQPIAMSFDDRGRLWVVECMSYPGWLTNLKEGKDRILIFEDTDGDGIFDKRTVFADNLANVTALQVGFGGVYVGATPYLLFIPDKNGRRCPRWTAASRHRWLGHQDGPQRHEQPDLGPGRLAVWLQRHPGHAQVGKPGTPANERADELRRVALSPDAQEFEAFAHGTTNPWGLDFDDYGEMFITNCVIEHLWHVVPGAHFERMFGQDLNPHIYRLMQTCADHIHWGGGHWTDFARRQGGTAPRTLRCRRRPRSRRLHGLPGRQLARRVSQQRLHVQHPRQPPQQRHPRTQRLQPTSPATARISCSPTTPGSAASPSATAPTAASTSATGPIPASATTTRSSIAAMGAFSRSRMAKPTTRPRHWARTGI